MGLRAPNHTQVPNEIFEEWLPKLGLAELKVLMVIIRKTFGWHKVRDRISLSQLETLTGLERKYITKAVRTLSEKRLICKYLEGTNGNQVTYYELVIDDDSNKLYQCPKDTGRGVFKTPTKETLTKESNTPIVPKGDPPFSSKTSPRKRSPEEKQEVADRVLISPSQHAALLKRADGDESLVKSWYDKLSTWKIGKEIFSGHRDFSAIIKWVIDAVKSDKSSRGASRETVEALDRKLAQEVKARYPRKKIDIEKKSIRFSSGGASPDTYVNFGDKGFREQVLNMLRKWQLSTEGL